MATNLITVMPFLINLLGAATADLYHNSELTLFTGVAIDMQKSVCMVWARYPLGRRQGALALLVV